MRVSTPFLVRFEPENLVRIGFSSPSLPAKLEERAGERRFVFLAAPLSDSLPTRVLAGRESFGTLLSILRFMGRKKFQRLDANRSHVPKMRRSLETNKTILWFTDKELSLRSWGQSEVLLIFCCGKNEGPSVSVLYRQRIYYCP